MESLPDSLSVADAHGLTVTIPADAHERIAAGLVANTLFTPEAKIKPYAIRETSSGADRSKPATTSTSPANNTTPRAPNNVVYAASTRAFISKTLQLLEIEQKHLLEAERVISIDLYHQIQDAEVSARSEQIRKEREQGWGGKWGRIAATAGGVTLGGVVLGLTGGLAAPALLPLIPFLSAGAAPAVLGSLFGLAGGGLTGYRVRRRWTGVERFEFVEISGPDQGQREGYQKQTDKAKPPSVVAVMMIPGIQLESETESLNAAKRCRDSFSAFEQDLYFVSHSPDVMLSTGQTLDTWVTNKLLLRAGKEILKKTALNAAMAALALPVTIYQTTGMVVDNEWIRGAERARKAGILLADVIREKVHGNRPLVLIGSSLGATALFEALLSLAASASPFEGPLIDSAIFISLPQAPSREQWRRVGAVVARRVVNAYCTTDFVLAGVGRLHEIIGGVSLGGIAGLQPVEDVESVDISDVLEGHFDIPRKLPQILAKIGMNC